MTDFHFYHPIEIRYGDLDPQGHVNNARYMTYLEQARIAYIRRLGLWESDSFLDVGIILANAQITFQKPILFYDQIQVGVRISRLGNKSLTMQYQIVRIENGEIFADASTVLVTYDYHQQVTIPIPENWRTTIQSFESLDSIQP
jgi:acyl-CoA thioester hydrolase